MTQPQDILYISRDAGARKTQPGRFMSSQPTPWGIYRRCDCNSLSQFAPADTTQSLDPIEVRRCPLVDFFAQRRPQAHSDINCTRQPSPIYSYKRVRPGDVGYTREGTFHLLFSAGVPLGLRELGVDVPDTFEPLDVSSIIRRQARPPGYLRTSTVRQIGVDVGGSMAVPLCVCNLCLTGNHRLIGRASAVEPGVEIAFELTSKQGAALITKHPTYREDIERQLTFKNYAKKHYQSWVDFSKEHGHGDDIRPILVTGVDLTREFAAVAYSDNQTQARCEFSAAVPTVASASLSLWGSWRTGGLIHTSCGPDPVLAIQGGRSSSDGPVLEPAIPDEYNQCVFIRYYTIRRRLFIPQVVKAGAGPHQPPESDPRGDSADEGGLQPSSSEDSLEVNCPETGPRANVVDEVVHNIPQVCPGRCLHLPLLTNRIKDADRDGFDIVAEFIFQVRKSPIDK